METKVFESPIAFLQFLSNKEAQLRTPCILGSWYWRAKLFYDPNVCGCKKKNTNQTAIEDAYRNLVIMQENEKNIAREIVGSSFTLQLNGDTIGTV